MDVITAEKLRYLDDKTDREMHAFVEKKLNAVDLIKYFYFLYMINI